MFEKYVTSSSGISMVPTKGLGCLQLAHRLLAPHHVHLMQKNQPNRMHNRIQCKRLILNTDGLEPCMVRLTG